MAHLYTHIHKLVNVCIKLNDIPETQTNGDKLPSILFLNPKNGNVKSQTPGQLPYWKLCEK